MQEIYCTFCLVLQVSSSGYFVHAPPPFQKSWIWIWNMSFVHSFWGIVFTSLFLICLITTNQCVLFVSFNKRRLTNNKPRALKQNYRMALHYFMDTSQSNSKLQSLFSAEIVKLLMRKKNICLSLICLFYLVGWCVCFDVQTFSW